MTTKSWPPQCLRTVWTGHPGKPTDLIPIWKSYYLVISGNQDLIKSRQNILYHFVTVTPQPKQKPAGFKGINDITGNTFLRCNE